MKREVQEFELIRATMGYRCASCDKALILEGLQHPPCGTSFCTNCCELPPLNCPGCNDKLKVLKRVI